MRRRAIWIKECAFKNLLSKFGIAAGVDSSTLKVMMEMIGATFYLL